MDKRPNRRGGPIRLLTEMYRKDAMVFCLFAVGMLLFAFAAGLAFLMEFR